MQNKIVKSKKGFTLMEVVMSMLIVGIIALFLSFSMPFNFTTANETQSISRANDLAQKYIEKLKSNAKNSSIYDTIAVGTTPPVTITSDYTDNGYFTINTNVADLETDIVDGITRTVLKEIDVEYRKASDSTSQITLSTLISRPR